MIPFKSCSHTEKERTRKKVLKKATTTTKKFLKSCSLHIEPTWEHKALFGSDSIFYARLNQSYGKTLKTGAYHHRRD